LQRWIDSIVVCSNLAGRRSRNQHQSPSEKQQTHAGTGRASDRCCERHAQNEPALPAPLVRAAGALRFPLRPLPRCSQGPDAGLVGRGRAERLAGRHLCGAAPGRVLWPGRARRVYGPLVRRVQAHAPAPGASRARGRDVSSVHGEHLLRMEPCRAVRGRQGPLDSPHKDRRARFRPVALASECGKGFALCVKGYVRCGLPRWPALI
jgi:hypothetical protein